jgi:hypothetical protein
MYLGDNMNKIKSIKVWAKQLGYDAEYEIFTNEKEAKARFSQLLSYETTLKVWYEVEFQ